uniref:Uncharacterized protein n=1 Tax=Lepeophtheirus salmonis TaxID=72036 RepID=A0A0K2TMH4_LEPSM
MLDNDRNDKVSYNAMKKGSGFRKRPFESGSANVPSITGPFSVSALPPPAKKFIGPPRGQERPPRGGYGSGQDFFKYYFKKLVILYTLP